MYQLCSPVVNFPIKLIVVIHSCRVMVSQAQTRNQV